MILWLKYLKGEDTSGLILEDFFVVFHLTDNSLLLGYSFPILAVISDSPGLILIILSQSPE